MLANVVRTDRTPRRRLGEKARRAAILAAAQEAFRDLPYDEVSIATVARAAHSSPALVHRYFGSKSALYQQIVRHSIEQLLTKQTAAWADLGPEAVAWDRLAAATQTYLDHVASSPVGWSAPLRAPGEGPIQAETLRIELRHWYVSAIHDMLGITPTSASRHAVRGYLAFVDAACLSWVDDGCQPGERAALVAMTVGALAAALEAAQPPAQPPANPTPAADSRPTTRAQLRMPPPISWRPS